MVGNKIRDLHYFILKLTLSRDCMEPKSWTFKNNCVEICFTMRNERDGRKFRSKWLYLMHHPYFARVTFKYTKSKEN